jgi:hypothetical protein
MASQDAKTQRRLFARLHFSALGRLEVEQKNEDGLLKFRADEAKPFLQACPPYGRGRPVGSCFVLYCT